MPAAALQMVPEAEVVPLQALADHLMSLSAAGSVRGGNRR
jgi:hypothetical protein